MKREFPGIFCQVFNGCFVQKIQKMFTNTSVIVTREVAIVKEALKIDPVTSDIVEALRQKIGQKTKPLGALGKLEEMASFVSAGVSEKV